jgi:murein DD-endopeptidase MepM/ murein hydrolase activator NlpD
VQALPPVGPISGPPAPLKSILWPTELSYVTHLWPPLRRRGATRLVSRVVGAAVILALSLTPVLTPAAVGKQSLSEIQDRLDVLQTELDRATAELEGLRSRQQDLLIEIGEVDESIRTLENSMARLEARVVEAANRLYRTTDTMQIEALLSAQSFTELQSRAASLAYLSELDADALVDFERADANLGVLREKLMEKSAELGRTRSRLNQQSDLLQARFRAVTKEYNTLKRKLAAAARKAAGRWNGKVFVNADGMTCPIAAPNSFIDSWGAPRVGHTHEGTDMMAAMGAPVVAITTGSITFSGVGVTAGNWLILSGDDGNDYYYMHNRENLVTRGRVRVGEQIATVGDTGNARGGSPHVHFEYHPNRGGPVNPYPLLMQVCRGGK